MNNYQQKYDEYKKKYDDIKNQYTDKSTVNNIEVLMDKHVNLTDDSLTAQSAYDKGFITAQLHGLNHIGTKINFNNDPNLNIHYMNGFADGQYVVKNNKINKNGYNEIYKTNIDMQRPSTPVENIVDNREPVMLSSAALNQIKEVKGKYQQQGGYTNMSVNNQQAVEYMHNEIQQIINNNM